MKPSNTIGREQLRRRPQGPNQGTTQISSDREFAERLSASLNNLRVNVGNSQHGEIEDECQQLRREGRKINEQSRQADDWEALLEEGRRRVEQEHRNRQQETRHDPSVTAATTADSSDDEDWEAQLEEGRRRIAELRRSGEPATNNSRAPRSEHRHPSFANAQLRYRNPTGVGNDSQTYCPGADTTISTNRDAMESTRLLSFERETMVRERQQANAILSAQIAAGMADIQRIIARSEREKRERMGYGNCDIYTYDGVDAGTPQAGLTNYEEEFQSPSSFPQAMGSWPKCPRHDGVAASDTPYFNAYRLLDLGLNNTSNLDIEARHGSTTEAMGQPRSLEVQTGRYPHAHYPPQTAGFRPISAPPQNKALDDGSRRATWKMATPGPTRLTRLNSEPGPMMQTRRNARESVEVMMFDHLACNDESKKKATDKWFGLFKDLVLPMFPEKRQQRPVKIAVLDTGIDINNPAIYLDRGKIKDKMSFVPNEDWTDQVGHGTQVTSLLLRMAYNAHIYVARVARGRKPDNPAYIAEALSYATESWKVDIINMSFGFNSANGVISAAIKNAYAANVLMFSAARNDGGNFDVAFPARHKDVICISATDGDGVASYFNPPVSDPEDNFATIGESLEFRSYKGRLLSISSGTSYATPVAVSIASLVLEYVRENFPDGEKDEAERRLKESPDGMRAALNLMSHRIKDHRYIAPWKLFDARKENNVYIHLSSALKNLDPW